MSAYTDHDKIPDKLLISISYCGTMHYINIDPNLISTVNRKYSHYADQHKYC